MTDIVLAGASAVVTGASSGMGAATAELLAGHGAHVVAIARRAERLDQLATRCATGPGRVTPLVADLAELATLDEVATAATHAAGVPDIVVNNAGVPMRKQIAAISPDAVEQAMAINYHSPVHLTLAFLPAMRERGSGHIVNVSSMGPHMVAYGTGAYSASKAALEMFTEALYAEAGTSGVHAHILIPGSTESEFSDDRPGNDPALPAGPSGRASPQTVAEAVFRCLGTTDLRTYATAADEAIAAQRRADPNAFVAAIANRLAAT